MLSLKVDPRPIFRQTFLSLTEEIHICCSATEQNNLEIASLITKRHGLEANTTDCSQSHDLYGFLKPEVQWKGSLNGDTAQISLYYGVPLHSETECLN